MARKLSKWNIFVKKVYAGEKKKNPNCKFSDALKKASDLKKSGKMTGGDNESDDLETESEETPVTSSTSTTVSSGELEGGKTRKSKGSKKAKKTKKVKKSAKKSRKSRK